MAKYTQSNTELLKSMLLVVSSMLALPFFVSSVLLAVAAVYLWYAGNDPFWWFYLPVELWGFIWVVIVLGIFKNYRAHKKISGGNIELSVTEKAIIVRLGDTRSEIPYSIIKKAHVRLGFLLVKIIGGGTFGIPLNKLSAQERKQLMKNLELKNDGVSN